MHFLGGLQQPAKVNESLVRKTQARNEYDKTIQETEAAGTFGRLGHSKKAQQNGAEFLVGFVGHVRSHIHTHAHTHTSQDIIFTTDDAHA